MVTEADYINIFRGEMAVLDFPSGTHGDVDRKVAEARRRVINKRNELTKDITKRWKDGFAALKVENDQMQRDLKAAYNSAERQIAERKADMYEGIQR